MDLEPTGRDKATAERVKATLVAPCDYPRWVRRDAWTLQEAVCIIGGIDPEQALGTMRCFLSPYARPMDTPGRQEVHRHCVMFMRSLKPMLEEMRGSHFAGKLKVLGPWLEDLTLVNPSEVIRWAASKGYDIPPDLEQAQGVGAQSSRRLPASGVQAPEETAEDLVARLKRKPCHNGEIMLEVQKRWGKPPRKIMDRAEIAALVTGETLPCKKIDASRRIYFENVFKNTVAAYRRQQT